MPSTWVTRIGVGRNERWCQARAGQAHARTLHWCLSRTLTRRSVAVILCKDLAPEMFDIHRDPNKSRSCHHCTAGLTLLATELKQARWRSHGESLSLRASQRVITCLQWLPLPLTRWLLPPPKVHQTGRVGHTPDSLRATKALHRLDVLQRFKQMRSLTSLRRV